MNKKREKKECGMITVETVLSLFPFMLLILGLISFINIFMVHNKIQYAMFQTGSELAAYTYLYHAFGVRDADLESQQDIQNETTELRQTIDDTAVFLEKFDSLEGSVSSFGSGGLGEIDAELENIMQQGGDTLTAAKQALNSGAVLVSDPQDLMRNLIFFGFGQAKDGLKSLLISQAASQMIPNYLESTFSPTNPQTADEYLEHMGVVGGVDGLDFSRSQIFSDENCSMIDIVVEYKLEIFWFKLFLEDPTITVVQRCAVPAWLDGDREYYMKDN